MTTSGQTEQELSIRAARPSDVAAVDDLLRQAGLMLLAAEGDRIDLLVHEGGLLAGCAFVKRYEGYGHLKSVAVRLDRRGRGYGRTLVEAAEGKARAAGLSSLYLLTETAESFFTSLGYVAIDRSRVPDSVRQSDQFSHLCPSSAVAMMKSIQTA